MRTSVQVLFLALIAWAGWDFYKFYQYLLDSSLPEVTRPPSVEAFLPISALLALKQWVLAGVYDPLHPAALSLLLIIIASALLLRRAFCSWICPVGTVVEALSRLGKRLLAPLGLSPWVPKGWAAYALSSLKYLLLAFFIYISWFALDVEQTEAFLRSPYNLVVDLKMLLFFLEPSTTTLIVLGVLGALSLVVTNFWCRFLCPYGAFLGLIAKLSPSWLWRDKPRCNDCGACERACPNGLKPQTVVLMTREACTLCLSCVEACPRKSLGLKVAAVAPRLGSRKQLSGMIVMATLLVLFLGGVAVAQWAGVWESVLTADDLRRWLPFVRQLTH